MVASVEQGVHDIDNPQPERVSSAAIGEDIVEDTDPNEFGDVTFTWRTPDIPGSIDVRITTTAPGGLSSFDGSTFEFE